MKSALLLYLALSITTNAAPKKIGDYQVDDEVLCGGYPQVGITASNGMCMGLVATQEDGLKRPRRILALDNGDLIVTDMLGWVANRGIIWRYNQKNQKLTKIFTGIDHAHGLGLGPEGLVYIGSRTQILRFNPENVNPKLELVIDGLPQEGNHPLTHFIFNESGDLIVNIGAPSDQCLDEKDRPVYPCPQSESENPEASIRQYIRDQDGYYTQYKTLARGLRNSMALAISPVTGDLYQGENSIDFKALETPREEINLIREGSHYGWPYCYEDGLLNPNYKRTFLNRRVPNIDCSQYEKPIAHLDAHSAPLDMLFYEGDLFENLKGKLIVSLHGYRETGHRIVALGMNEQLFPTDKIYEEVIFNWTAQNPFTPKGSPVGMSVDKDGNIWLVEDKNKTILKISKKEQDTVLVDNGDDTQKVHLSEGQKRQYSNLFDNTLSQSCMGCHDWLSSDATLSIQKLVDQKLIIAGDAENSIFYQRLNSSEYGTQMPIGGPYIDSDEQLKIKEFIDALN